MRTRLLALTLLCLSFTNLALADVAARTGAPTKLLLGCWLGANEDGTLDTDLKHFRACYGPLNEKNIGMLVEKNESGGIDVLRYSVVQEVTKKQLLLLKRITPSGKTVTRPFTFSADGNLVTKKIIMEDIVPGKRIETDVPYIYAGPEIPKEMLEAYEAKYGEK